MPHFERGLCGGLAVVGANLSYLKQSVRVENRWLHGPPSNSIRGSPRTSTATGKSLEIPGKVTYSRIVTVTNIMLAAEIDPVVDGRECPLFGAPLGVRRMQPRDRSHPTAGGIGTSLGINQTTGDVNTKLVAAFLCRNHAMRSWLRGLAMCPASARSERSSELDSPETMIFTRVIEHSKNASQELSRRWQRDGVPVPVSRRRVPSRTTSFGA